MDLHKKAFDAFIHCEKSEDSAAKSIAEYMKVDWQSLVEHWYSRFSRETLKCGDLVTHLRIAGKNDFLKIIKYDLPEIDAQLLSQLKEFEKSLPNNKQISYVSEERIKELSRITSNEYDVDKLLRILQEINVAYNNDCFFTLCILLRAILDHVPPIFAYGNFEAIANNYKGTKSFKKSMKHLNESSRNIAASYLHVQIRNKESLPNINQVDFKADLDWLLAEIARILA